MPTLAQSTTVTGLVPDRWTSAEYGHNSGADVNVAMRSESNPAAARRIGILSSNPTRCANKLLEGTRQCE